MIRAGELSATLDGTLRIEGTSDSCMASDHRLERVGKGGGG